jgi:carboxypeptidase family protein
MRRAMEFDNVPSMSCMHRRWCACAIATALLVALCFGRATCVLAQVAVSSGPIAVSSQNSAQKFTLTGTVTDAMTGEPIRKALVSLNGTLRQSVFSDADGRFQFDGVPGGTVSLYAQKPGYFNEQDLSRRGVPPVEVGPNAAPVVVKLTPESIITGKVTDAAGIPLEHVSLSLNYIDIRDGRRRWEFKGSANTDEDGRFRFSGLRAGSYYVSAAPYTPSAENLLDAEHLPKSGFAGVYYPGVPDLASASPIQLAAGQQAEANFSLNEVPVYAVSGTITGYGPNQGVGLQVFDQSGVQVPIGVEFSPENGRFDVYALAAGSYVIKAYGSTPANQAALRAELRFNLAADTHHLHLVLAPAPSIPVVVNQVSTAQSDPARRARFAVNPAAIRSVSVRLIGSGPGSGESYAEFDGTEGKQNLILRNVEPGQYSVVIDAHDSWYVASAESGQTNLLTDDLVVPAGAPPLPLAIELRNDSAVLTGTVTVPDGVTGPITIVAVPDRLAKASPRVNYYYPSRDKSVGDGGFVLNSLAPGDYSVFAFDRADGIEFANRDILQTYASQAGHLTLSPSQRAKITLPLIRTAEEGN